jgi:5'-nucleotidase
MNSTRAAPDWRQRPRWDSVDIVLLDMDGTLLDLRFDNYFWLQLVPERYAARHGITLEESLLALAPRFAARQGTLDWYCTDFWSRELSLNIAEMKREVSEQVRFLPGAELFLKALQEQGVRTALVTNAHHDALAIKSAQTGLTSYFHNVVSSHRFGVPKEHPQFWTQLQAELQFDPARALFVDDSRAVLQAAHRFGIGQIFAVSRPDSTQGVRDVTEFAAVEAVVELLNP